MVVGGWKTDVHGIHFDVLNYKNIYSSLACSADDAQTHNQHHLEGAAATVNENGVLLNKQRLLSRCMYIHMPHVKRV
jgi:hypothetical protein